MPSRLIFRVHAIQRMFQRSISEKDVAHVLTIGETVEEYPDDSPYPSRLVSGRSGKRPLHIVVADKRESNETIVITAYEPDEAEWKNDFKKRK